MSGRDISVNALQVSQWHAQSDVDNLRGYGFAQTSDGSGGFSAASTRAGFVNFRKFGSTANNCSYGSEWITSPSTADADATALAQAAASSDYSTRHYDIQCSVNEYCIPTFITAGDWVYVYSPDDDIWDATNSITFQSRSILPAKMRCVGYTWPLQAGMGVAHAYNRVITDITDYIVWETGSTSLELDSAPFRLIDPKVVSAIR